MNQSVKSNGWILCPSKSFPGKFYYFNVLNGEAVWCLDEAERKSRKIESYVQNIADKSHCYPEPSSPPEDEFPTMSNFNATNIYRRSDYAPIQKSIFNDRKESPVFGQATFPKYFSNNAFVPRIVWAPVELPTPTFINSAEKNKVDRITQSRELQHDFSVHTSNVPLSGRFTTYGQHFNKSAFERPQNQPYNHFNRPMINKFYNTSTVLKNNVNKMGETFCSQFTNTEVPKTLIREPMLKRSRTQSESDILFNTQSESDKLFNTQSENDKLFNTQSESDKLFNTQSESDKLFNSFENLACQSRNPILIPRNKVDNAPLTAAKDIGVQDELDHTDLRYLLVAKRRKSVDLGELHGIEGKKPRTEDSQPKRTEAPKKRVTFNLADDECISDEYQHVTADEPQGLEMGPQKPRWDLRRDLQYVVADEDTLIDELAAIEEYLQADSRRRLLLPPVVRAGVQATCVGDCRGRQRVIVARQIARRLLAPPDNYVLLPSDKTKGVSIEEDILDCCLQLLEDNIHLVLITNNKQLQINAESLNIPCLKPQDLKNTTKQPEATFELKNLKISVQNELRNDENLFLQPASESQPYVFGYKNDIRVDCYRTRLFDDFEPRNNEKKMVDAITSPIMIDKEISRRNYDNNSIFYENATSTNEIRSDFQNLFIQDKSVGSTQKENFKIPPNQQTFDNQIETEENSNFENGILYFKPQNERQTNLNFENGMLLDKSEKEKQKTVDIFENGRLCLENLFEKRTPVKLLMEEKKTQLKRVLTQTEISKSLKMRGYNIDDCLMAFKIKNSLVEQRVSERIDEWICCLTQTLEDALTDVLLRHSPIKDSLSPPWVLYEVIEKIKVLYILHVEVKIVAEKFNAALMKESSKEGKLKNTIKPNDFMRLLGCGTLLVQMLKVINPDYKELSEAESSLQKLLENIENTSEDIEEPVFQAPVICRSDEETATEVRRNFMKKQSDIIDYLKRNFAEWESYDSQDENEPAEKPKVKSQDDCKIIRTFGRDLNLLKIDSTKSIQIQKPYESKNNSNLLEQPKNNAETRKERDRQVKISLGNEDLPANTQKNYLFNIYGNTHQEKHGPISNSIKNIQNISVGTDFISTKVDNLPKIVRKIDLKKTITHGNTNDTEEIKGIRKFDSSIITRQDIVTLGDDLNIPKHGNTFGTEKTAGPKVIRNVQPIKEFEGKIKNNPKLLDLDALDYTEEKSNENATVILNEDMSIDSTSFVYEIKNKNRIKDDQKSKKVENYQSSDNVRNNNNQNNDNQNNDNRNNDSRNNDSRNNDNRNNYNRNNDNRNNDNRNNNVLLDIETLTISDDNTNDSGFENESTQAYSLVKIFLVQLSSTFKAIFKFLEKTIKEIKKDELREDNKRIVLEKANKTQAILAEIINNLKSIIQRESNDGTSLKTLLTKAGNQVTADLRITRYRQVVTKCLEQAQILESALKLMLSITEGDYDVTTSDGNGNIPTYFNIFE